MLVSGRSSIPAGAPNLETPLDAVLRAMDTSSDAPNGSKRLSRLLQARLTRSAWRLHAGAAWIGNPGSTREQEALDPPGVEMRLQGTGIVTEALVFDDAPRQGLVGTDLYAQQTAVQSIGIAHLMLQNGRTAAVSL